MTFEWYTVAVLVVVAWYWSAANTRERIAENVALMHGQVLEAPTSTASLASVNPHGESAGIHLPPGRYVSY